MIDSGPVDKAWRKLFLIGLFRSPALGARLHVDDQRPIVVAAVHADAMRQFQFFASRADLQRHGAELIVRAAAIAAALRVFAFW